MEIARKTRNVLTALAVLPATLAIVASAQAATTAPHWTALLEPAPAYFHPGETAAFYELAAVNDGGAATSGEVKATITLPRGVTVKEAEGNTEYISSTGKHEEEMGCVNAVVEETTTVTCKPDSPVNIGIDGLLAVKIEVEVPASAAGRLSSSATITGGGAQPATVTASTPVTPAAQPPPYGVSAATGVIDQAGGIDTQAGSHPASFTTLLGTNVQTVVAGEEECGGFARTYPQNDCADEPLSPRDVEVALPAGLVGDPLAMPRCTQAQFESAEGGNYNCPADTQVGTIYLTFYGSATAPQREPVYNVEPPTGQPAELGFTFAGTVHVPIFFHVRSDGDYGLTTEVREITQYDPIRLAALTIWGVPAEESHNPIRDSIVSDCASGHGCAAGVPPKPFLTLPTSCGSEALPISISSDSWQEITTPPPTLANTSLEGMGGCEALAFEPSVVVTPTTSQAGAPAGYDVSLDVPQHEEPTELATPDVRNVEVTMPEGTVINPSAANGLQSCSEAQFGLKSGEEGHCPSQALIGHVSIKTPLLEESITGNVYVGEPECSPCSPGQAAEGKMVKLLIEAEPENERGNSAAPPVLVKLEGRTEIDQSNGQLTTKFDDNPQLPFSELSLELEGGQDAPLVNPASCGPIVANASLTPWSSLTASNIVSSPVSITGCGTTRFSPSLTAGMTSTARAAGFSAFSVTISRPDGQQDLGAVTVQTPEGLSAILNGVTLCGEGEANVGACPAGSQIGEVTTVVGQGSEPYTVSGGHVYLTTGYKGGSFGLSIVVPAEAGPYHLTGLNGSGGEGNGSVVIRGSIEVNPVTAALTIKTNPIPTVLDGIPLHIQRVIVNVNRSDFMFNPTNCDAMSIESTISSSLGTSMTGSYPFQAVNCGALKFEPTVTVSTGAHASKKDGQSLNFKIAYPKGAMGSQSWFKEAKFDIPKQLPVELNAIQQACIASTFETDRAACPTHSIIGHATVHTQILPVPLEGPIYFVSYGNLKFPDAIMVLSGYGITVELVGETFIDNKTGVTSATFANNPDVPFESIEVSVPAGEYSEFGSNLPHESYDFCGQKLKMPTLFKAQNGLEIHEETPIAVVGCPTEMSISSRKVKGHSVTLTVYVPAAGKLKASGNGLGTVTKSAGGTENVTLTLHAKHAGRFKTKLTLTYTPAKGKRQSKKLSLRI